ncbi:hypothetical protein KM043_010113 [Ampulex compressa]|nr:hypothetical protein KM043_010113 [Ampulex compressa]
MVPRKEKVILCRGISGKEDLFNRYVETLESDGYRCQCLHAVRFNFVNGPELRACLETPQKYLGLILTSRRAVEAIELVSKTENILSSWRDMPVYCVGPATESIARSCLGFRNCLGSESGDAEELAKTILKDVEKGLKPLLHPCSEISGDTIKEISSIVEHITKALNDICYNINNIKAVAIGPATKQTLVNCGFEVHAIAKSPNPGALLEAIQGPSIFEQRYCMEEPDLFDMTV